MVSTSALAGKEIRYLSLPLQTHISDFSMSAHSKFIFEDMSRDLIPDMRTTILIAADLFVLRCYSNRMVDEGANKQERT